MRTMKDSNYPEILWIIAATLSILVFVSTSFANISVSKFSGDAVSQIPIEVPPGRNGIQPNLALTYSSSGGNGWLGVGWSLDMGSIQRSTKKGVNYSSNDFVANGVELVPVSVDSSGNGEYRAKIESKFTKYFYNASTGWVGTTTDGTKYFYGQTSASRQGHFKWCLNRVEDTNGNYMGIDYIIDQGQIYPDRIGYTGNSKGLPPINYVKFYYDQTRSDAIENASTHSVQKTAKRLTTIDIQSLSGRVSSYLIFYSISRSTSRSHISEIRQYGINAVLDASGSLSSGSIINRNIYRYSDESPVSFPQMYIGTNGIAGYDLKNVNDKIINFDYNGDGKQDLFLYRPGVGAASVARSNGDGTFSQVYSSLNGIAGYDLKSSNDQVIPFDYNGDGLQDLFFCRPGVGAAFVARSNGDGTFSQVYFNFNGIAGYDLKSSNDRVFPFDYNDDGLQDLFLYRPGVGAAFVARSNGDGTFSQVYFNFNGIAGYDLKNNNDQVFPFDYNGDGLQDLFLYRPGGGAACVARSNGNGTFSAVYLSFNGIAGFDLKNTNDGVIPFDYNGDGLQDLLFYRPGGGLAVVARSNGNGSFPQVYSSLNGIAGYDLKNTNDQVIPIDYNHDGRQDLLFYRPGSGFFNYARSNGNGTFCQAFFSTNGVSGYDLSSVNDRIIPLDYSGNGRAGLLIYRPGSGRSCVLRSGGIKQLGLISSMSSNSCLSSSSGYRSSVVYKPSSSYKNKNLPIICQTVSSISVDDGLGNTMTTGFDYAGGFYDSAEREFRGFETVIQKNLGSSGANSETAIVDGQGNAINSEATTVQGLGTTIKTTFHQDKYRTGLVNKTEVFAEDGTTLLSLSQNTWDASEVLSTTPERVFVKLAAKANTSYDNGAVVSTSEAYTYYTINGAVRTATVSGQGADDVVTTKEYVNYGDWVWRTKKETVNPRNQAILRQVEYDYFTGTGNLKWQKSWLKDAAAEDQPVITYGYDSTGYGNLTTVTDARGFITTTEYDTGTQSFPVKVTRPETGTVTKTKHVTEYLEYDYRFGKPKKVKDENGNITTIFFDKFGRTERVDSPDGGQVVTIYKDQNFPRKVITLVNEKDTDANKWVEGFGGRPGYEGYIGKGMESHVFFDWLGREIQKTEIGEKGKTIITQIFYDELGRPNETVGPFFGTDYTDFFTGTAPANCPYSKKIYDKRGRVIETISPDGTYGTLSTTLEYSGLTTTLTDADGKKKTEKKDYLGRLVEVIEYGDANAQYHTYYTYNIAGDLLTVTDHQGNVTTITYDTLGRKKTMTDPDMKTWQYPEYDKNNNLKRQIDANGVTTSFDYDELNRMTKKSYSTSQSPVIYTYDETAAGKNGIGVLTTLSNGSTVIKNNVFDVVGRLKSQTKTIAGTGYTTQYTYDLSGKTKTITYPDNYAVTYDYHPRSGLLSQVTGITDFQVYGKYANYDVTGKIGTLKFGNDTVTEYTYDPQSKMLKSYHNWYDNVDPSKDIELQNREYTYTRTGDIKDVLDKIKNTTYSYTYDTLHRLRTETNSVNSDRVEYTYNPIGGIQTKTTVQSGITDSLVYAYDGIHAHGVSKITRNGTAYTFGYDTNGSMTSGFDFSRPGTPATRNITYNADRMPVTINRGGVITTLEYDGAGTRTRKIAGGKTTVYVGDHYEVKNGVAVKYIFGGNLRIAKITANTVTYFHKDHLGSSVLMTDAAGKPVSNTATSYKPFGEDRVYSALDTKDYKYTDQEYDSEAGLYNYNARMYDPAIGVFVSADIFVQDYTNPQTLNRYAYCLNNPMIYVDPSGYWSLRRELKRVGKEIRRSVGKANDEIDRFCRRHDIRINRAEGGMGTDGENWDFVGPDGYPSGGSFGPDEEYDERSSVYEWYQQNNSYYSYSSGSGIMLQDWEYIGPNGEIVPLLYAALNNNNQMISFEDNVLIHARTWIGVPYFYGGNSRAGIDCSHLVYRVYSEAGRPYPYRSVSGFPPSGYFLKVDFSDIKNGDVITFPKHMGIYDNGRLLSARSGLGRVDYSSITDYYGPITGIYRRNNYIGPDAIKRK